jgi:hypothetical protein
MIKPEPKPEPVDYLGTALLLFRAGRDSVDVGKAMRVPEAQACAWIAEGRRRK